LNYQILNKIFIIAVCATLLVSCGNKKRPTGGKKDLISPVILNVSPDEFSELSEQDLEITFSKPIDQSSILTGITTYPPILNKKYKWDGNTLIVRILEDLEKDSNYFISFNTNIKGEHGNKLDQEYIYTFKSGKLNDSRISGNFIYELEDDRSKPVKLSLLSSDSVFVFSKTFTSSAYSLDNLNLDSHVIRAYIDKNENSRYDYEKEPYTQVITDSLDLVTIDLELAYADTVKPVLSKAKALYNNLIEITASEPISRYERIEVFADSTTVQLPVYNSFLTDDKIEVIIHPMDTLDYKAIMYGIEDFKGNVKDSSAVVFTHSTAQDSFPPVLVKISPRNGTTVNSLLPEIEIEFSEIIMKKDFEAELVEVESGKNVKLSILTEDTKKYLLKPAISLDNYSSYRLKVKAKDFNGVAIVEEIETLFIAIVMEK